MKNVFKKSAGSLVFAATAMGVGGAAIAPSAHAADAVVTSTANTSTAASESSWPWYGSKYFNHGSAHYTSLQQCNYYRTQNLIRIAQYGRVLIIPLDCAHETYHANYWTYYSIDYSANQRLWPGDRQTDGSINYY